MARRPHPSARVTRRARPPGRTRRNGTTVAAQPAQMEPHAGRRDRHGLSQKSRAARGLCTRSSGALGQRLRYGRSSARFRGDEGDQRVQLRVRSWTCASILAPETTPSRIAHIATEVGLIVARVGGQYLKRTIALGPSKNAAWALVTTRTGVDPDLAPLHRPRRHLRPAPPGGWPHNALHSWPARFGKRPRAACGPHRECRRPRRPLWSKRRSHRDPDCS